MMEGAKLLPLHVKKDPRSVFEKITEADFDNLSTRDVQEKLRKHHVVITGVSHKMLEFNEKGFSSLEKSMNALISIQGNIYSMISIDTADTLYYRSINRSP
jgi:hypothetical protein